MDSENELVKFREFFPRIRSALLRPTILPTNDSKVEPNNNNKDDNKSPDLALNWYEKVLDHMLGAGNEGKMLRGLSVVHAVKCLLDSPLLCNDSKFTSEDLLDQARAVGWSMELGQSALLLLDDMMDSSTTRRGKKCWYIVVEEKYGFGIEKTVNDGLYLEHTMFEILERFLSGVNPAYEKIVVYCEKVCRYTVAGQTMDLLVNSRGGGGNTTTSSDSGTDSGSPSEEIQVAEADFIRKVDLSIFTRQRMETIHAYKTAYYTVVGPLRSALYLVGVWDEKLHLAVEAIAVKIGVWFQVQDDYLDCYGDQKVTGKKGTDIQDGKVTWLAVEFLRRPDCSQQERDTFVAHYGQDSRRSIDAIKLLYAAADMQKQYATYERDTYDAIQCEIAELAARTGLPAGMFDYFLTKLYQRVV